MKALIKKDLFVFVDFVKELLNLGSVEICDDNDHKLDNNTFAGYVYSQDKIIVNYALIESKPEAWFLLCLAVAHELRHMWQSRFHLDEFFKDGYVSRSGYEYERQFCEVDAAAFSYMVLDSYFGKQPVKGTWKIYSFDLIMDRVKDLREDFEKNWKRVVSTKKSRYC